MRTSLTPVLLALAAMFLFDCTLGPSLDDLRGLPCEEDKDCPILGEDCRKRDCVEGRCTYEYPDTEVLEKIGDCQGFFCDGSGEPPVLEFVVEDAQVDDNPCTVDQCAPDKSPLHVLEAPGVACGEGLVCDAAGTCVQCIVGVPSLCEGVAGCTPEDPCRCNGGICLSGHCINDAFDELVETDEDCGNDCPACADGLVCDDDADCQSAVCLSEICQAPSCTDGTRNGKETGEDCGGDDCPVCGDGQPCIDHDDCESDVCIDQTCQSPTCSDATANGNETDIDCGGGPPCDPCGPGKHCELPRDCVSGNCRVDDVSGEHICGG